MSAESKSDANLEEEYMKICEWLKGIGLTGPVDFEINQETIGVMSQVMRNNQEKDRDQLLIIQDMERKTKEYEAETKRLDEILIPLTACGGFDGAFKAASSLAQLAVNLDLDDTSDTSYYVALHNLVKDTVNAEYDLEVAKMKTASEVRKTEELVTRVAEHEKILETLKRDVAIEDDTQLTDKRKLVFLDAKRIEYKNRTRQLMKAIDELGMHPLLKHETLTQDYKNLESIYKEVAELQSKLDAYRNLPADISLAKVALAEAEAHLEKLDDELNKHLNELS